MVTPPWMQAVVPSVVDHAVPVDPMAAVLAELKALRAEVSGLRSDLRKGPAPAPSVWQSATTVSGTLANNASDEMPLLGSTDAWFG